jgi:tyrosine-protein phosphatase YwqE
MIWPFKKKQILEKDIDLGILNADMHSHLIPGIDDGSKSIEESITLIRELKSLGYKKIITSPHIQNEKFKNTADIINSGLENLRAELEKSNIQIEIEAAAEYLIDDGFIEKYKQGKLMTFGDNYILVELSYYSEPMNLKQLFFDLQLDGYKIILAHPERYTYWHNNLNTYQELFDRSIYLQLNINSLTGWYSKESQKIAKELIDRKLIKFLGTDLHNEVYLNQLKLSLREPYLKKILDSGLILNSEL